jgi:transcriptional regulator with PAS, ATPase and Fis domain
MSECPIECDLAAVLLHCQEPIYLVNAQKRIIFFNAGCEQLTGWPADSVVGLLCRRHGAYSADDPVHLAAALCPPPQAFAGQLCSQNVLVMTKAGETLLRQVHFYPLRAWDGTLSAVVGLISSPPQEGSGQRLSLPEELAELRYRLKTRYGLDRCVARAPAMQRVLRQVRLASATPIEVALVGEPGSGRRHLARTLHGLSPTADTPLVFLDASVLPAPLLARQLSELLHEAPHQAQQAWGTLVLVEPQAASRDLQRQVVAFCEHKPGSDPLRVVVVSSQPLTQACHDGLLLPEFAALFSTLEIVVPPLRDRREDIGLLTQYALDQANAESEKQVVSIRSEALRLLETYAWPGNVAQLFDVVRQAHAHCSGQELTPEDLPVVVRLAGQTAPPRPRQPLPLDQLLAETEKRLIRLALQQEKGNLTRAAARLGISPARLSRRMAQLGVRTDRLAARSPADNQTVPPGSDPAQMPQP